MFSLNDAIARKFRASGGHSGSLISRNPMSIRNQMQHRFIFKQEETLF